MPDTICDTSPLQYLHQLRKLDILPALTTRVVVPPAVVAELQEGLQRGIDLPEARRLAWLDIRRPTSAPVLPLVTDLGAGEREVLALALETPSSGGVLDDRVARRVARGLGLKVTGTLGLLLDAKRGGHIEKVAPLLDELESLRFRLAGHTRTAVLKLAGEADS